MCRKRSKRGEVTTTTTWNASFLMALSNARGNEADRVHMVVQMLQGRHGGTVAGSTGHDFHTDAYHMHKARQPETQDITIESGMMDME